MRAERFGSYSIPTTRAAIPRLSRRKSMTRYFRLWPPPRCRIVILPRLLRPPVEGFGSRSDASGSRLVISSNVETVMCRRLGVTGL